ncbi:MAG: Hsp70 family protein, partial [Xanthomonadales bacterium]|nr:Hsp70 family protein [Xanthomonadales bacterium]NIU61169.1 Hsp70 family protein [Stutzerimonas stutzeri]NIX14050.1 Hsp70 family protein [Xanthomonadales bacterium]
SSGLSKEEVDRMQKDADAHADEDRRRREEAETRNRLDTMIYSVEKLIRDNRDKLDAGELQPAEAALDDARKALNEGGLDRMNAANENLTQASHRLAEAMYRKTGAAPGGGAGPQGEPAAAGKGGDGKAKEG